jgi:hypothetical protein
MSDHQQWVAAADMLTSARNKGDGGSGVAPDDLISKFQVAISSDCEVVATKSVAEIAVGEYLTSRSTWRP